MYIVCSTYSWRKRSNGASNAFQNDLIENCGSYMIYFTSSLKKNLLNIYIAAAAEISNFKSIEDKYLTCHSCQVKDSMTK